MEEEIAFSVLGKRQAEKWNKMIAHQVMCLVVWIGKSSYSFHENSIISSDFNIFYIFITLIRNL